MPKPHLLLERLSELARGEWQLRLVWGVARTVAVAVALFLVCCGVDWLIDLWYDTPFLIRWFLRIGQCMVLGVMLSRWIVRPLWRGLTAEDMVFWVEQRQVQYGHQLISAVQLNAEGANRDGMSESLIDALTHEAEQKARATNFLPLLDRRRLKWSFWLVLGTLVVVLLLALIAPATILALAERQCGSNRAIPRSLHLYARTAELWPRGEPVTLRFLAEGNWSTTQQGTVEIAPEGQSTETYRLQFLEAGPSEGQAWFSATVPASSTPFSYRAWLFDGRTREPGHVTFAPRPIITAWEAWLLLPDYVGLRVDRKPYELAQPKGDLKPVPGCQARINVTTQTPIVEATVELLGPIVPELASRLTPLIGPVSPAFLIQAQRQIGWTPTGAGPLFLLGMAPLQLKPGGQGASAVVTLPLSATAYRVVVTDQHGLSNRPVPRRAISFHRDELPQVTLLPERFNSSGEGTEDTDLEGMPIPLNRPVRIGYLVRDDLALKGVALRYRINEGPWERLPLTEVTAIAAQARFDVRTGAFDNSSTKDQVGFYPVPPDDPEKELGRSHGGGRFDFQTRALPGLKVGDVVEYFIEAADHHDDPSRLPGRSVVRRKTVVTEAAFVEWLVHTVQQENRLRQVEKQQKKVFEPR